jgi:hypothetical protein
MNLILVSEFECCPLVCESISINFIRCEKSCWTSILNKFDVFITLISSKNSCYIEHKKFICYPAQILSMRKESVLSTWFE